MWIVRDSNDMRLSPFLVAIFAASTTFGISKSANAQISETDIDTDFISLSISSKTEFSQLSSAKSFLELGSSFSSQLLFGSSKSLFSKSWSEAEVKLEFYGLLKVKEVTKSSSVSKKGLAQFLALDVLEKTEIPQLTLINKSGETKSETLVNKQFAATIPTTEIVDDETQNSQTVVWAKSTETKSEPLVNKQFAATIPTTEIVDD
ncbi:hypothetical protein, partial [Dapis sp. BLCC M229]|uniref:hypothetical protein n=1 Tax=Dapis sp. BLCC M229 TaxID=3400188 RepID=UPI003CF41C01